MFQHAVKRLEASYASACGALLQDVEAAKDEALRHQERCEQGLVDDVVDQDEDGYPIETTSAGLAYAIEAAEMAVQDLRKAYALALYHQWERAARSWTGETGNSHSKLCAAVENIGHPLSPCLTELRLLVNTIKHEKAHWGDQLLQVRSDLFPEGAPGAGGSWYDAIRMEADDLAKFFVAVRGSGPTEQST